MLTFLLKEEPFHPDSAQRGGDGCCDDLQRLQVCTVRVDLTPALLQVEEDHLLIHLQGTLDTQETHLFNRLGADPRVSGWEAVSSDTIS